MRLMRFVIFLGSKHGYYEHAYGYTNYGEEVPLTANLIVGRPGPDMVRIEGPDFLQTVQWLVHEGAIEFYGMGKNSPEIGLINESGTDIRIDRYGVLRNGESMRVEIE